MLIFYKYVKRIMTKIVLTLFIVKNSYETNSYPQSLDTKSVNQNNLYLK